MVLKFLAELYQFASSSSLMPVIEFAVVGFIVMITYLAMHTAFSGAKQGVKFIFSAMIGVTGYTMGKLMIIAWVINPILADSLRSNNPFLN